MAAGGPVDTVPAMLTPGEFVMSRNAVKTYGTGFMNQLNRGIVPGFNKGGTVGTQYFANGGSATSSNSSLEVNVNPRQVTLNIPELHNVVADVMQKISLNEVSKAFANFVANLQGANSIEDIQTAAVYAYPQQASE
jgi:hypothetical protein